MNKITFFLFLFTLSLLSCTRKRQDGKTVDRVTPDSEIGSSINQRDSLVAEKLVVRDSLLADSLQPVECIFTIQSGRVVPNPNMIDTLFQANKKATVLVSVGSCLSLDQQVLCSDISDILSLELMQEIASRETGTRNL